jgi:hypothetical protein
VVGDRAVETASKIFFDSPRDTVISRARTGARPGSWKSRVQNPKPMIVALLSRYDRCCKETLGVTAMGLLSFLGAVQT